jgi:phosphohistidine swiveling domain-containing protein
MEPIDIQQIPLDSDALRANIGKTAQQVVIPDRYLPLVEAVEGYYGVKTPLVDALREYFHTFRNIDLLIDGFQTILLRNWSYFERSDERTKMFTLLSELVLDLLDTPLSTQQTSLLLRQLITWCTAALSGPHSDAYDDPLRTVAETLLRELPLRPFAFLERDTLIHGLVRRAAARPVIAPAFFSLYRSLLLLGYRLLEERLPIPAWAVSGEAELTDPGVIAQRFAELAPETMAALIDRAESAPESELLSSDLPAFSTVLDRAIDQVFRIGDIEDRFAVCLYFLKDDTLGYRQNEVMVDLLGVVRQLMKPEVHYDIDRLLSRLTRFFRQRDNQFLLMRFQCYEAIGVAIGQAGNAAAADHLIEDVLSWKFQYPEIQGATDEWETVVNPFHLPKIRCWMHIIESNPALYERLAAALNVQLRLGGVYIADTDLFQRDVTRFLNADIGPIYFVAKQLLRAFPVYFNDVGAEGELRAVTTEIDEVSGRQDTLMHFLRKQSHAESSNRLVDFSREVLAYWATLDPAGLQPYLSANTFAAVGDEREWALEPHNVLVELEETLAPVLAVGAAGWRVDGNEATGEGGSTIFVAADRMATAAADSRVVTTTGDSRVAAAAGDSRAAGGAGAGDGDGAGGDGGGDGRRRNSADKQPTPSQAGALLDYLIKLTPEALDRFLDRLPPDGEARETARRRVALMIRTHQLLAEKYSLSTDNIEHAVSRHLQLDARIRGRFVKALDAWRETPGSATRDRLLDAALGILEELQKIILSPAPSAAVENIYQKRHIAAGIPSMYGNYSEPKFDALGLSFRVERLVAVLLDDLVSRGVEPYVTRDTLRRMAAAIRRFERALATDGVDSRNLGANLRLLQSSFGSHNFTFHQYQNVFQFFMGSVTELSRTSILSHDQVLHTVLKHDPRQCVVRCMSIDAVAEMVLREVLVSALGMQSLDRYMSTVLRQISTLTERMSNHVLTRMMNYDPERLVSRIHRASPCTDDQMTLGFKGLGLKQMAAYKHKVPQGFILTTELFSAMPAMAHRPLYKDTVERVRRSIGDLEKETGLRLGDPKRLLTLSIRSGAAISMPGLMTTFVDVGLNDKLAEALSRKPGFEWAAWDSYRRFLQTWAMASGIDRDVFDAIMVEFKARYGVERKSDFLPEHMREMAFAYKDRGRELGVRYTDDPFRQVMSCIRKVLASWDSPEARLYRQYLGVAEEWGTAVVVQRMVFGNLSRESGSGVTFTRNPLEPYSNQVRLFGDFTARSQGEDLVAGLVFPWPVSEAQRLASPTYRGLEHSLEKDHPLIYQALLDVARDLVGFREHDPQEIEFTFESDDPGDLYILQKRAMVQEQTRDAPYFDTSAEGFGPPVTVGMGVAGGAYSGRVAVNVKQIDELAAAHPGDPIVLLRPDTVPEDIAMITRVSGLLTARGGATSHAAVTAKRLGKTAVVDCRALEVDEHRGVARLAGQELETGDWLSIDGRTGNIFLGRIPTTGRVLQQ